MARLAWHSMLLRALLVLPCAEAGATSFGAVEGQASSISIADLVDQDGAFVNDVALPEFTGMQACAVVQDSGFMTSETRFMPEMSVRDPSAPADADATRFQAMMDQRQNSACSADEIIADGSWCRCVAPRCAALRGAQRSTARCTSAVIPTARRYRACGWTGSRLTRD